MMNLLDEINKKGYVVVDNVGLDEPDQSLTDIWKHLLSLLLIWAYRWLWT